VRRHFPRSRPPQYEVEFIGDVRIPSSVPGLTLGGDLYLPKTTDRVPALVTLHTGRKDGLGGIGARKYLRYFAERGYAVLYVDCFGIGTSEGVPRPILSPGEVDDGVAVVEWTARQPWCTGAVGMWGLSHGGMTTLAVASRRPAPLRAIFPVMGWTDVEQDLVHPEGLRGGIGMFGHLSLYNIFCALLPPLRSHDKAAYATLWKERLEKFEPWFADSWNHPPGHDVWLERRIDPRQITVPALCVAGWRDLFCDVMIGVYQQIRAPKQLLVGPWLHSFPDVSGTEPVPSVAMACEWWDRWLHGRHVSNRAEKPATFFVQGGSGRWVHTDHWPPEKKADQVFVAAGSGHLYQHSLIGRPSIVVTATRMSDVTVGALSGLTKHPIDKFGHPLDQHDDDVRSLSFTSAPLPEPILIAGRPMVRLLVAPETTAARCVVKVTDVDEQGRSVLICTGTVDLTKPRSTGAQELVPVQLDPTCYQVPAGHRVRLVLAESDIPRLWPVRTPGRLVVRVIHASGDYVGLAAEGYGGQAATTLSLPVCDPDDLTTVAVPQREYVNSQGVPRDRWEITRDHMRGSVRLTVAKQDRVSSASSDQDSLAMKTLVVLGVNEHDPAKARMVASGEMTADTGDGDQVAVRAAIDMGTSEATVTAEVVVNGTQFLTREWRLT
jgi:putative CocE/NonD family hydrolase